MSFKKQVQTIRDNWLIVVALVVLVLFMNMGGISSISQSFNAVSRDMMGGSMDYAESAPSMGRMMSPVPPYGYDSFAPQIEERKITKSANLHQEVEQGMFSSAEQQLKGSLASTKSILLNENVNVYESGRKQYRSASYQIKVPLANYDALVASLKSIGEVKSFSESQDDITQPVQSAQVQLAAERARLERYQAMFKEASRTEDKITLSDRMFEQERTIKYLEESLKNLGDRVDYSTVYAQVSEKQPRYAQIVFVKFSELVKNLVDNVNSVLSLLFSIVPWAVLALIVWGVWKFKQSR